MKKLLLLFILVLSANLLSAQVDPIYVYGRTSHNLCIGTTYRLADNDSPSLGTWSSSNTGIATVGSASGILTGVSSGVVTITYTIYPIYATATFTVNANPGVPMSSVSTICIGSTVTFTDTTLGGIWTSASLGVANIGTTSGIATGVGAGTSIITYTNPSNGCFEVGSVNVNSVAITGPNVSCLGAGTTTLTDATPGGIWSSSDPTVASIGSTTGIITPVASGHTTVTYNDGPGCIITELITVRPVPFITPSPISACVGVSTNLTGTPAGGSWGSSDPLIASINFVGVATGVAAGSAVITYVAPGGCQITTPIVVNPLPLPITGATFLYSFAGASTITLGDATAGGSWSSGNPALATVDASGVVTGVSAGLLYISYTIGTGCSATFRIQVDPLPGTSTGDVEAWYPFCDGDTSDYSHNGHTLIDHGAFTTKATPITDRYGDVNNAYGFDGVKNSMYYTAFLPVAGVTGDFTYSCWVKPASLNQSAILVYNGNPNFNGFGFVMDNGTFGTPGSKVSVLFGGIGEYLSADLDPAVVGNYNAYNYNGWYNLVLVKNGGSYRFYIGPDPSLSDAATVGFFISGYTPMTPGSLLNLGFNNSGGAFGNSAFAGGIDDVTVVDRQLSNAERLSLLFFNPDATHFSLGNDTTICSDYMFLAPNPQTIGANYLWETQSAFGSTIIDSTDTLITVYPNPGLNTYTLAVTKPFGCSAFDTILVTKTPIPVNLGPDLQLCIGDTISLSNFFPRSSFLWSTGDTSHSIQVTTSGTYYVAIDSTEYFPVTVEGVTYTDSSTCVGRDTVRVNFYPIPVISLPKLVSNCDGSPYVLTEFYDPAYSYKWNDNSTSNILTAYTSGLYFVKVTDIGCSRYDTVSVTIVYDTLTFTETDKQICKGASVIIGSNVTNNFVANYQWTPTAGISASNVYDPVITPDTSAEYRLTVSYPGCADIIDSFHIDVQPIPKVDMGGTRSVCQNDTLHLLANITQGGWYTDYTYTWSPATYLNSPTGQIVIFTGGDTTKMVITVTTPAGCEGADSAVIFVHPGYFDTLVQTHFDLCPGDSVQLIPNDSMLYARSGNITGYHWSPGIYLSDSTTAAPWVHPITSENYILIATNQYGCHDTLSADIVMHPAAVIYLGDSVILYPGDSYQIVPQTNCVGFIWFPPLGLSDPAIANPIASPVTHTTYHVHATTEAGCAVDDSLIFHVDPATLIAIPNAFTPGAGVNSTFSLIKRGTVALHYLRIFNRWGTLLYETTDINAGWDGTYHGVAQPFGVYVYELEAVSVTGGVFTRQGNVTLIR